MTVKQKSYMKIKIAESTAKTLVFHVKIMYIYADNQKKRGADIYDEEKK